MTARGCGHHTLLPLTQDVMANDLAPDDWLHVADFLMGILQRAPIATHEKDATGWRAERLILGVLATELRLEAHEAGSDVEAAPLTFGTDPVGKARAFVERMAAEHDAADRRSVDAMQRADRLQEAITAAVAEPTQEDDAWLS